MASQTRTAMRNGITDPDSYEKWHHRPRQLWEMASKTRTALRNGINLWSTFIPQLIYILLCSPVHAHLGIKRFSFMFQSNNRQSTIFAFLEPATLNSFELFVLIVRSSKHVFFFISLKAPKRSIFLPFPILLPTLENRKFFFRVHRFFGWGRLWCFDKLKNSPYIFLLFKLQI